MSEIQLPENFLRLGRYTAKPSRKPGLSLVALVVTYFKLKPRFREGKLLLRINPGRLLLEFSRNRNFPLGQQIFDKTFFVHLGDDGI